MAGKITAQERWQRDIRQRFKLFSESGELDRLKRKGLGVIGRSKKMTSEELLAEATKGRRMRSPEYLAFRQECVTVGGRFGLNGAAIEMACLLLRYKPYRLPYIQEAQWPRLLVVTTINDEVFIRWLHHHAWGALAVWGKGPLLEPVVVKQEGFQRVPVVLPLAPPHAEEPTRPSTLPPVGCAFLVSLDIPLEYPPEAAADLGRASTQYGRELARRMGYDMPYRLRGSGLLRNAPKLRLDEEVLGPNEIGKMVDAIYGELDLDGDRKRQNLVKNQRHRAKKLLKGESGQV